MGETFHEKIAEMEKNILLKIEELKVQEQMDHQNEINNHILDALTLIRSSQTATYPETLNDEFKRTKYYSSKFIEGKDIPTKEYNDCVEIKPCHNTDSIYPHLYHTSHPQLNCMTDMIRDIQDFLYGRIGKDIIKDLDRATTLLYDYIKEISGDKKPEAESRKKEMEAITDIIKELKDITKRQLEKQPVTIEDLSKHFQRKMEIVEPSHAQERVRPPLRPPSGQRFANPSIFTRLGGYHG